MRIFALILIFCTFAFSSEINRNLIAFYDGSKKETERLNAVHQNLEVILDYYGYIVDYADIQNPPKDVSKYGGALFWFNDNISKNPLKTLELIADLKNDGKKIIWIGDIPLNDGKQNYVSEVNAKLEKEFGFKIGDVWSDDSANIRIKSNVLKLNYERKYGYLDGAFFSQITPTKNIETLITASLISDDLASPAVFKADWGVYAQSDKLIFKDASDPQNIIKRWIVNPFEFVKNILPTNFPIPDVTTIDGKRVAFIHIDGDGAVSKSEVVKNANCAEVYYQKIAKIYPFKTGVSFIVAELDKKYKGNDSVIAAAKEIYALAYIEPASHTYTHPFDWSKGITAFAKDPNASTAMHGEVVGYSYGNGSLDVNLEINKSVNFINTLLPKGKTCDTLYWSGDCLPTKDDLKFAKNRDLRTMNGSSTFFDNAHPSYAYVYPMSRYVDGIRQIYAVGSNENIYTSLWLDNFWGFGGVVETFKRTGAPIRIKPIDLYYHMYSLSKMASYKALDSVYKYLNSIKNDLYFIYPSEYMKSVEGFYEAKIYSNGVKFEIKNSAKIKTYRFDGAVKLKNAKGVKNVIYDQAQKVTYISINGDSAEFEMDFE